MIFSPQRSSICAVTIPTGLLVLLVVFGSTLESKGQEYRSSVVGTDFDFITEADPSCFFCLEYKKTGYREMPDKSADSPLIQEAFIFVAYYTDGTEIDIAIDSEFQTVEFATKEAERYVKRLGKLPTSLRSGVERLVVHRGNPDTTAFSDKGLIVLYSANATKRISTHDLEETLFHESVHASWDSKHAKSADWIAAQESDGKFVTDYARKQPRGEDLAESALFAYSLIHFPGRIPAEESQRISVLIPARIKFVENLIPATKPLTYQVRPQNAGDNSGKTFHVDKERFVASQREFLSRKKRSSNGSRNEKSVCEIDLQNPGHMKDIVSNALMLGLKIEEPKVQSFLKDGEKRFKTGDALMFAAAAHFKIEKQRLKKAVLEYKHVNCEHEPTAPNQ